MRGRLLGRHRDFRLFWVGETASLIGSAISTVALPLVAVEQLGAGPFAVGVITAAVWLPWLLVGLPAGVWVDRVIRRPVMLGADVVSMAAFASVPIAAWLGVLSLVQMVVVALVSGAARVAFETAYEAYLPSLLDPADLSEGNAALQTSSASSLVVGPSIAGGLAAAVGAVAGLLVDAATFVFSAVCLLLIRFREPPVEQRPRAGGVAGLAAEVGEGLRFVFGDPYLRALTLFGASLNMTYMVYAAIQVVFLLDEVRVGPGIVGVLVAIAGVGGVAGALVAGVISRRVGTARGMLIIEVVSALAGLMIPLAQRGPLLALFVVGSFVNGAGVVAVNVIKSAWRQAYCPRHLLGRAVSAMQLLNYGAIPIGALGGGALGAALGTRPTVWISSVGLAASIGFLLAGPIRRDRDLPTAAPAAR
ncbi:MFS transporter [Pseudonocardia xinjiangensis]|uniref:MFS transporter n=1 Tax=Pseudonocardia xinjiangensis TaxID=75289 RepID=UPI003D8FA3D2